MRNSLAIILDRKGLSRRELADMTGYSYKTVSAYETSERPLSKDFLEKAAVALGVSIEEIEAAPEIGSMHEEAPAYHGTAIPLELLSDHRLLQIKSDLAMEIPKATGRHLGMLLDSLRSVAAEMDRRRLRPATPIASSTELSEEERIAAEAARLSASGDSGYKRPLPEAGERGAGKDQPPAPSGPGSKTGRPGTGGKVQK